MPIDVLEYNQAILKGLIKKYGKEHPDVKWQEKQIEVIKRESKHWTKNKIK